MRLLCAHDGQVASKEDSKSSLVYTGALKLRPDMLIDESLSAGPRDMYTSYVVQSGSKFLLDIAARSNKNAIERDRLYIDL
jgi:hypothetical protein